LFSCNLDYDEDNFLEISIKMIFFTISFLSLPSWIANFYTTNNGGNLCEGLNATANNVGLWVCGDFRFCCQWRVGGKSLQKLLRRGKCVSLGQRVNGTRNEKDTLALEHSNSIFPPNSNLMNSSNVGYLLSNTFIKIQNKI